MTQPADEDLAARSARGSLEASEMLFERHWRSSWRIALTITGSREAAEDVCQEALHKAFRRMETFDGRGAFAPWLHRIVVNAALDHLRRERRRATLEGRVGSIDGWTSDPVSDSDLFEALGLLAPETRLLIALRYWLDYRTTEIAEVLDLPVGTVSSRLSRALSELRTHLEVSHVQRP